MAKGAERPAHGAGKLAGDEDTHHRTIAAGKRSVTTTCAGGLLPHDARQSASYAARSAASLARPAAHLAAMCCASVISVSPVAVLLMGRD